MKRMKFSKRVIILGLAVTGIMLAIATGIYFFTRPHIASNDFQVRAVVYGLGDELRLVTLDGEAEAVAKDMDQHYAYYVRPDLLATWKLNPNSAPGRYTGKPVPDRIEIQTITVGSDPATYTIEAVVVSKANGPDSASIVTPVRIIASQGPDGWQISSYEVVSK